MADEKDKVKPVIVHNSKELRDAVKAGIDNKVIIFDESPGEGYGMAAEAARLCEAMYHKGQATLDKLDDLVKVKKKDDLARLKLLKKEKHWTQKGRGNVNGKR